MSGTPKSTWQLIFVPALITLAVTILRLIGELQHWSPRFFSPAPGGGAAIVGITWLVPIFGIYFAMKLSQEEGGPESKGKALGLTLVGILIVMAAVYVGFYHRWEYSGYLLMLVSWIFFAISWGGLTKTLFVYGFAARIPVVVVMFIAISQKWETHYSAFPPGELPVDTFMAKIWHGAVLPQCVFWITYTLAIGLLFGVIASFFVRKSTSPAA